MIEGSPTDEHPRPGDDEPRTEAGRPRPSGQVPGYPRPQAVPEPPPPAPQPPPQQQYAPPPQYVPPQPYVAPQAYAPQPQPYQPAPPPQPPPQQTVQGGGGTLWLRPESTAPPAAGPAPPAGYLGAPVANPYPGYAMPVAAPIEPANGKAVAAMVLGIVGLIFLVSGVGILFFINLPCSILAWIFGVQGRRMVDAGTTTKGDGMATAGFWTGIVGTVLGVLAIVLWIVVIAASA